MRNRFDMQLQQLDCELIQLGALIEHAIAGAAKALTNMDEAQAKEVMVIDDEIDHKERDIERLCLRLLLQQQPVARDLRLISAALKMITDMERIGDQVADIAELAQMYAQSGTVLSHMQHIDDMARATIQMVTESVDAFVKKDLQIVQRVITYDDVVDDLFDEVKHDLVQLISAHQECGEQAIDLLMIAKYFERIGDHAANVAEWVAFSMTGEHETKYQDKQT